MKSLVLLSFSLTFLTQGIANDFSHTATNENEYLPEAEKPLASEPLQKVFTNREKTKQVKVEEPDGDQMISLEDDNYLSDAEEPEDQSMSMQPANPKPEWCLSPYHQMHASIRHNESRGIGYNDGYTTLEAFGIYDGYSSSFMPFVDLRGHVFNDGKLAGNIGIGERTLFTSIDHVFGAYLYYDVRRVGHGLTVNQLSPGVELVGERMEYRINGYFPVGEQKGHQYGFKFDEFDGHRILLKFKQYQAMKGFDAEVGAHLTQDTKYDVYAAAGPYYFSSSNASSWGGRARLLGRYKEYISLEVAYSYDNLFRSVVQGSVALTFPFGRKLQRCGPCCPQTNNLLLSRAAFAPSRFEIPVVKKVHRRENAINPATGDPWTVWFVNNTSHSAGTFESPFPTLLLAQNASSPNDMIYVFPGDGTTTGMDAGITLQDGQNFFGSGIKQQFATSKGTMTIPAYSANNPSITNTAGNVVTLGNSNVVSGFNVSVNFATSFGITSFPSSLNITNATIANNVITVTTPAFGGISINGSGAVNIYNNQLTGPIAITNLGILLRARGGVMYGTINNNSTLAFSYPIFLNIETSNPGSYDFTIQGNTITNYAIEGISAYMLRTSTINIIGNTVTTNVNSVANAIEVLDSPSTISGTLMIRNNQIAIGAPNNFSGIKFTANNSVAWNLNAVVTDNSVLGVGVGNTFIAYGFTLANTDTLCLTLNNNTYTNPATGSTGLSFDTTAGGTINIDSIQGNVVGPISTPGTGTGFVAPGTCGD